MLVCDFLHTNGVEFPSTSGTAAFKAASTYLRLRLLHQIETVSRDFTLQVTYRFKKFKILVEIFNF